MARASQYAVVSEEDVTYRPKFHSYETDDITMSYEMTLNGDSAVPLVMRNSCSQRRIQSTYESNHCPIIDVNFLDACKNSDEELLTKLIDYVPSLDTINQQDKTGRTSLYHVSINGNLKILEMLAQLPGLDINLGDNEGNTPLMVAAQSGHLDIISFLVDKFSDILLIDQRNVFGLTALMKAALQGKTKCAKLLLSAGANPYLCDPRRNYCALQWAKFCCRYNCADAIEKFMKTHKSFFQERIFSSSTKWNSNPELNGTAGPSSPDHRPKSGENGWLKQKIKKTFRYDHRTKSNSEYRIMKNMTSAAVLCASSAILQNTDYDEEECKKGIVIPKLEVLQSTNDK